MHDRFQKWQREQVFTRLWHAGLLEFDQFVVLDWQWQSMDEAMTKAPLGGKIHRTQPLRLRQKGTKRSVLTEGHGLPIAVAVEGANRHDVKLLEPMLQGLVFPQPEVILDQP